MSNDKMQRDATIKFELTVDETNLMLEALGQLPFARVYMLIGRVQELARAQLQPATAPTRDELT